MVTGADRPAGCALVALAAAVLLSACATRVNRVAPRAPTVTYTSHTSAATMPTSSKAGPGTVPPCRGAGSGFSLSLADGFRGSADPVAAARWFARHGAVAGYGNPSSVWVVADPWSFRRGAATLVNGTVSLHAVLLPNRTWAVDSGTRCG